MAASETLYERLRKLAIADPKSARTAFLEAFEAKDNELPDLLEHLRKQGEARLRQVIANAVRAHPSKQQLLLSYAFGRMPKPTNSRAGPSPARLPRTTPLPLPPQGEFRGCAAEGSCRGLPLRFGAAPASAAQYDAVRPVPGEPPEIGDFNGRQSRYSGGAGQDE